MNAALTPQLFYTREGLIALDQQFVGTLLADDTALYNRLVTARANPQALSTLDEAQLLIELAPQLESFLARLFGIEDELNRLQADMGALAPLYACKRLFVQRKAAKAIKPEIAAGFDGAALAKTLGMEEGANLAAWELRFAGAVMQWQESAEAHVEQLNAATQYAAWALYAPAGKARHGGGILFRVPHKLDPQHLVPCETELRDGVTMLRLNPHHMRARHGFSLTDDGGSLAKSLDEAHYCILCHHQGKDSCSKGMERGVLDKGDSRFKTNPLGIALNGCPLEERISEMHELRGQGVPLGALAMIVVDNPMCAGTGHRICNDCMKSCIFQKQEPVNIPQSETRVLRDVLALPYGFEIYSLLTRWNPLNLRRPLPLPASGKRVLVAGMGPAGYTLAHHLMNDGHTVVGIDGLKIEPLPPAFCGVEENGARAEFFLTRDASVLFEDLASRAAGGFGGVAEYGITVRWDKNFLTLLRLLLVRREQFSLIGGVRFGSNLSIEDAWSLGFDHIALCMGAGKPTVIDMPGGLARGVRTASDFLMALQLTGAARARSLANLQLRLPVVVVGGGLTAIDTATEALAYYPVQVEKFLARYEVLAAAKGEATVRKGFSEEEAQIADEFLAHAHALRIERGKPKPDVLALLKAWGGVTMAYRKALTDAPSYRLNHEEVEMAMQEGIFIAEHVTPLSVEVDQFGHAKALRVNCAGPDVTLHARTVLIAAGTSPNTVLAQEEAGIALHGRYFQAVDEDGATVTPEKCAKPTIPHVLMTREADGRAISFFGDMHPSFAGNVVKAMGSAKQGYPVISRVLAGKTASPEPVEQFFARVNNELRATVHAVHRLTPTIVEVVVHAPLAARRFKPGQFYRLQNFEAHARQVAGRLPTTLAMEGLALTGAAVDVDKGLLSTIVLEMGGSSNLCAELKPGEPIVLMGPTGEATHIPEKQTVLLAGGGLGNAVLFSIGAACREQGNKVLYFAGYNKAIDRYKVDEIEKAADVVVWCCDEPSHFTPGRPQDKQFTGNIVQAMLAYAEGGLGERILSLADVDYLLAIGSDRMMQAVGQARHTLLKPFLKAGHQALGSINSPMQCMMKEICAQCLQQHIDPQTGAVSYVYSCKNQDQKLDDVSFPFLRQRLMQNSLQEKITAQWIELVMD